MSVRARSMSELERKVAAALQLEGPPADGFDPPALSGTEAAVRQGGFSICPWDPDFEEFVDGAIKLICTDDRK